MIVGEQAHPGGGELADLDERLPLEPLRDRGRGEDVAESGLLAERADLEDDGQVVGHRLGVRHRAHGRVPTGGGRAGPRLDRLLVLESRLPEVGVEVDEPRRDDEAAAVQDLGAGRPDPFADRSDQRVLEQDVRLGVVPRRRVDEPAAAQEEPAHQRSASPAPRIRYRSAIRTAIPFVT